MFYRAVVLCAVAQLLAATIWCHTLEIEANIAWTGSIMLSTSNGLQTVDDTEGKQIEINCTLVNIKHETSSHVSEMSKYICRKVPTGNVTILMNDNALKSTSTKFREYGAEYKYQRGEIINTTCLRNPYTLGALQMKYFDANDNLLFATKLSDGLSLTFRSRMTSKRNNSYIQCSITLNRTTDAPPVTEVRRLHYIEKQRVDYPLSMRVNGLELVPRAARDAFTLRYEYHYVDGDLLNIVCVDTDGSDGNTNANIRRRDTAIIHPCVNRESVKLQLTSEFTSNEYQPHITGLRGENILYQHTDNLRDWTTYYRYRVNETLRLACVAKVTEPLDFVLQWDYEGRNITNVTEKSSERYDVKSIDLNITLGEHDDSRVIKCQTNRYLLRTHSNGEKSTASANLILVLTSTKIQTVSDTNTPPTSVGTPQNGNGYVWLIAAGSVTIFIISALCLFYIIRRYKKNNTTKLDEFHNDITDEIGRSVPLSAEQYQNHQYRNHQYQNHPYQTHQYQNHQYDDNEYAEIEHTAVDNTDSSIRLQDSGHNEEHYLDMNRHLSKPFKTDADYYEPMSQQHRVPIGTSDTQQLSERVKNDTKYDVPMNQPEHAL